MTTAEHTTLDQALALARRLSLRDQAHLIAQLVEEIATTSPVMPDASQKTFTLPILTGGTWTDDLPMSRKDLYGDDERC